MATEAAVDVAKEGPVDAAKELALVLAAAGAERQDVPADISAAWRTAPGTETPPDKRRACDQARAEQINVLLWAPSAISAATISPSIAARRG